MFEKLNLGMRGHDTSCDTPEALADTLAAAGAVHVQLALKKSFPWISGPKSLTPALGKYLRKLFADRGITVSVLGCYINPVEADEEKRREQLEWFKANLKFSKYLGADMVGTETGIYLDQARTHTEETYQRLLSGMRELAGCAEKTGAILGVESVTAHTLCNPVMMRRFLDDINSPSVTVIFDPVNMLVREEPEYQHRLIDEMYRLCGDRIGLLHLKDYRMEGAKPVSLLSCDSCGVLDYAYLFDRVLEHTPCIDAILEGTPESEFSAVAAKVRLLWQEAAARREQG